MPACGNNCLLIRYTNNGMQIPVLVRETHRLCGNCFNRGTSEYFHNVCYNCATDSQPVEFMYHHSRCIEAPIAPQAPYSN